MEDNQQVTKKLGLSDAIIIATKEHDGQVDKAGQPYILHVLRVMMRGKDDEERIVGVLHDTVEDGSQTIPKIKSQFGERIADGVDAVTRRAGESYDQFIDRCALNELGRIVKIYDLDDNLREDRLIVVTDKDRLRTNKYKGARQKLVKYDNKSSAMVSNLTKQQALNNVDIAHPLNTTKGRK